jgi:crotonobetainyl-CoA:carnitine CoA-transferase CaiB-like acyl-CoA transferase
MAENAWQQEIPLRFDASAGGPLNGVRVLDLSRLVAGNMLSLQLADFGADVIKVEPERGDPLRDWRAGDAELYWKVYGRNKRSIVLDLRKEVARGAFLDLVAGANVLIENFRPGTLEKMSFSPEVLHARNRSLIIVRISGFGQTGPYAERPGFGTLVEAMSGFASRTGFPDREPVLLAALRAQSDENKRGQVIDLSLLEAIFSVLGPEAAIYQRTGEIKKPVGSASSTAAPRNVYRCRDGGYVALSASTQTLAKRVFEIIGQPQLIDDPRFRTNSERVKNRVELDAMLAAWIGERTREEVLAQMQAADVTIGPVYNIKDILDDAHFHEREIVVPMEDADYGAVLMHNIVPRLSGTPGVWKRPAPALGQHTEEIMREAGVDPAVLDALLAGEVK